MASMSKRLEIGGAGYRSRYLSHAKRALFHVSYAPDGADADLTAGVSVTGRQGSRRSGATSG